MTPQRRAKEERFLPPQHSDEQRYQMPPLIDADPEEIGRKIMSVGGYAKRGDSKADSDQS